MKNLLVQRNWRVTLPALTALVCVSVLAFLSASQPTSAAPVLAPQDVVIAYDFESGPQDWVARSSTPTTTVEVVTEAAHGGTHSLKVTGRTQGWHGASVDVTSLLQTGVTYEISGCLRLVAGQTANDLMFSMARTTGDSTQYTWVTNPPVQITDAGWTCIYGTYSFAEADQLILYVESRDATVEFYIDDVSITSPSQEVQRDIPSVYQAFAGDFLIGAAIEPDQLASIRHSELLTRHFNSLTAENAMKPVSIQPTEGTFNWEGADQLVQFAREHNIAVHGHTLEWHEQVPAWFFEVNGEPMTPTLENKTLLLNRLETHIRAVAGRYKDDVNVWDVVNEVIDQGRADCMRRNTWYEITGMDYISTAFNVAHEVVPTATLILNDYGTTDPQKRECIYRVVRDLRAQGVPVEGIGMQKHINIQNPTPAEIEATIERFASLGVEVHITELDMSIYTSGTDAYATPAEVPEELLIAQGHRYKELFEVFKRHADVIGSVTFWGLADDHTWLTNRPIPRVDMPMLFDRDLQAKYAYTGIISPTELPVFIQQLNSSGGTPTIDGEAESLWTMLAWNEVQPPTADFTATFQTRWDATHLYLFLNVAYPAGSAGTAYLYDAVDVFIDEGNDKAGAYGADDWHYRFLGGQYVPVTPFGAPQFAIVTSTTGYRLEAAFPLSAVANIGDRIGFDLRLVDGNSGDVISWNDLTNAQNTTTANWGTLTLIGEYKQTTALEGTPVIDANEDTLWIDAAEISTDVWVSGDSGSTAKVRTLWDSTHLYIYAVVSDSLLSKASSNPWEQDSIEAFVDQNNAKTVSYEADDGQFRINFDNEQSFRGTAASTATLESATRVVPGGYIVEMAIALNDFPPQVGGLIGFDFQVNNDQDGDGDRDSVALWNDPTGQSYQNTSRLGVLQFVTRTVGAPVADFYATPTSGNAPLEVTFSDQSTNLPTTWLWDLGDGVTSTLRSPAHTYSLPGVYTVTLTAGNTLGSDTEVKTSYITVTKPVFRLYLPVVKKAD
ncbi:MAG: endo-1,4-beta-xylanase [Thermoflexales bacterium]|nr:endo-1,4-beta-xylanase [Thermoflexales bacterium]